MRKLILSVMAVLFITTSAWALDNAQVKKYVEKHFQITKKIAQIKTVQKAREMAVNAIKIKYNYDAMMAEIKAVQDLYQPQIQQFDTDYELLIKEIEIQ